MKEDNTKKWNISKVIFVMDIIVVIILAYITFRLYNNRKNYKVTELDLSEQSNVTDENANSISSNNEIMEKYYKRYSDQKEYVELNEANYNENKLSRVTNITNNNDGTFTLISRVFEEVKLPTLFKEELAQIENGEIIDIFGYMLKKDDSKESDGYDFVITSVDENNMMSFYVSKNDDGTASLSYYSEMQLGKATQKYMRAIVDSSVLGDDVSEYSSEEMDLGEYCLLTYSEEFEFKNGEISSFKWTGV